MAEKKRTPTFSENLSLLNERLENVSPQKLLEISYGPTGFLDFQKELWGETTTDNVRRLQDASVDLMSDKRRTELGDFLRLGLSNKTTREQFKNNLVSSLGSEQYYDNALKAHLNPQEYRDWESKSNEWKPRFSSMSDNKFSKLDYNSDLTDMYVRPYVPKKTNAPLPNNPVPTPSPASNAIPSSSAEGKTLWESAEDWYDARREQKIEKEARYLASKYDDTTEKDAAVSQEQIKTILKDSVNSKQELDQMSFDRLYMNDQLNISNEKMERLSTLDRLMSPEASKAGAYLTIEGSRFLNQMQLERSLDYAKNEAIKDSGSNLHAFGIRTGWSHSAAQAAQASRLERAGAFFRLANPIGASSREILSSNLGRMTSELKIQNAKSGSFGRVFGRMGTASNVLFTGAVALQSDDPLNEFVATTALTWGVQHGWRTGKALGSLAMYGGDVTGAATFLGRHAPRVLMGGLVGGALGAVGYGSFKLQTDLTKSDSNIVGAIRNFTTRENSVNIQDSQLTLTMRQQALQKLSSSALNNRGQLLGNEADVLRGNYSG